MSIYEDYMICCFLGFHVKVLQEYYREDFLEICCQGLSREIVPFTPIGSSRFALVFSFEYQGKKYFHKTFISRNWLEPLKDIFRGNRSERALRGHLLLHENGFHAPRINVVGRKGAHNFMVSEAGRKISDILQFLQQMSASPSSRRRKFVSQLGRTIGQLHHLGISHGDLRLGNIIIDISDPYQLRYYFLDNERTVRYRKLPKRKRLKNLVQLNMISDSEVTKTDRLRFFKAYLRENSDLLLQEHTWLVRITKKTHKRMLKKARKATSV